MWIVDRMAHIIVEKSTSSVKERGKHHLIDSHLKYQELSHGWNFAHFQNFDLTEPIEEKGLSKHENEDHWLELAIEESVHNVRKDKGIGFLNEKFWSLIEWINFLHQVFLNFKGFSLSFVIEQTYEIISSTSYFNDDDR